MPSSRTSPPSPLTPWLCALGLALGLAGCSEKAARPEATSAAAKPAAASQPAATPTPPPPAKTSTAAPAPAERGARCGGRTRNRCEAGWYCEFSSRSCDRADATGDCVRYPEACGDDAPKMCDCDRDLTYDHACAAQAAGARRLVPCGG